MTLNYITSRPIAEHQFSFYYPEIKGTETLIPCTRCVSHTGYLITYRWYPSLSQLVPFITCSWYPSLPAAGTASTCGCSSPGTWDGHSSGSSNSSSSVGGRSPLPLLDPPCCLGARRPPCSRPPWSCTGQPCMLGSLETQDTPLEEQLYSLLINT